MSQSSTPAGKYLKVCCCVKSHSRRECMTERTKRARMGFLKHSCQLRSANFHSCQTAPKKAGLPVSVSQNQRSYWGHSAASVLCSFQKVKFCLNRYRVEPELCICSGWKIEVKVVHAADSFPMYFPWVSVELQVLWLWIGADPAPGVVGDTPMASRHQQGHRLCCPHS